eukprot:TRINITY_DN11175_c0_g1_i1.p1 TRINITY_DN11175_c0_g1~~TRINITY_DN11175_c0_g1_i1.p1  ORF type:complete len:440 (+),score=40.77 TRINITY_DN11175_c0_g1_i1:67-1386(+)
MESLTQAEFNDAEVSIEAFWILIVVGLVFSMHIGFLMVEVGQVRVKNSLNLLFQNVFSLCLCFIVFYMWGYAFTVGHGYLSNPFIGDRPFFLIGVDDFVDFMRVTVYATVCSVLISGCVAERMRVEPYMLMSLMLVGVLNPLATHWLLPGGWLAKTGAIDQAGGGYIFLLGGVVGFWSCYFVGPRLGRFVDGKVTEFPGHSIALSAFGVLMLWFGWIGMIGGSSGAVHGRYILAERAVVNAILCPVACVLWCVSYHKYRYREYDIPRLINAVIFGLSSISACGGLVSVYDAIIIGSVGAAIYESASYFTSITMQLDDVVEGSLIYGLGGAWSLIAVGLFAHQNQVLIAYPLRSRHLSGLLYGDGWELIGIQLMTTAVLFLWATLGSLVILVPLRIVNMIRVPRHTEEKSVDFVYHGGYAYPNLQIKVADFVSLRTDIFS